MNAHQRTNYSNSEETAFTLSKVFTHAFSPFFREIAAIGLENGHISGILETQNDPLRSLLVEWLSGMPLMS